MIVEDNDLSRLDEQTLIALGKAQDDQESLVALDNTNKDDSAKKNDSAKKTKELIGSIAKYLIGNSETVTDVFRTKLNVDTPFTYDPTTTIIFRELSYAKLVELISDGACQLIDPKTNTNRFRCKVDGSSPDNYFLITWKIDNGWILPDEIERQDRSKGPIGLTDYSTDKYYSTLLIKSLTFLCGELNSGKKIIAVQSDKKENVVTRMMKIINDKSTKQYTLADHINDMVKFVKLIVNHVRRDDSDTHRGGEQDITSEVLRKYLLSADPEKQSADSEKPEKPKNQLTLTLEGVAEIEEKLKQEMTLERIIQKFKKCTYCYYIKAKLNEQDVTIKRDLKLEDDQGWEIFIQQLTELVCESAIEDPGQGNFADLQFDNPGFTKKHLKGFKHLKDFLTDKTIMTKSTFTGHEIAQIMKLIYLIAMDGYMRGARVLPGYAQYYSYSGTTGNQGEGFCLDHLMDYSDLLSTNIKQLEEIQQTIDFVNALYEFVRTNFKEITDAQIIPLLRDGFKSYHQNRDTASKAAEEVQEVRGIGEEGNPELADPNAAYSGQNAPSPDRSTTSLQVPLNNSTSPSGQNAGYPDPKASSSDGKTTHPDGSTLITF